MKAGRKSDLIVIDGENGDRDSKSEAKSFLGVLVLGLFSHIVLDKQHWQTIIRWRGLLNT